VYTKNVSPKVEVADTTKKKRTKTPSFIAEFPLHVTIAQSHILEARFNAARNIYNAVLSEALVRLSVMRESKTFKALRAMPKGKPRTEAFKALNAKYKFTSSQMQKFAETCRDACWIKHHLGSHDTQTTSLRAFRAVQQYAFGKKGRPRFKQFGTMESIEGKSNVACIRLRNNIVLWYDLLLPLIIDESSDYQRKALESPVKYVRIVKREINARILWYAQIVCEGNPPPRKSLKLGTGETGLDIGPSTIAIVSENSATLTPFCPTIVTPQAQIRRQSRALDRSRRATNPENYDNNGTIKKGKKKWQRSNRYKKNAANKRNVQRCQRSERKRSHGQLQNKIIRVSSSVKAERVSYKAWQKIFGKSVGVRAPGFFQSGLERKLKTLGGDFVGITTQTTKLSQYDHTTDTYVKKPLSQRIHIFGDGVTAPVQRDLYSAFLARHCDEKLLNASQAKNAWPSAEPLLRQAALRVPQLASGSDHIKPHGPRWRNVNRQSKSSVEENQNGTRDRGSRSGARKSHIVRATKNVPMYDPRIPRL
jgi:putative transposase